MAYADGSPHAWVIETKTKWPNEDEYQERHKELLDNLKETAIAAAETDFAEIDWLVNQIAEIMAEVCQIAKQRHDSDDDSEV